MLGVKPAAGRLIMPADDRPGAPAIAVISYEYWTRRFGSGPGVIGKTIRANNTPVTIVGVTEPQFTGVQGLLGEPPEI